jgi:hypothetical protein
VNRRPLLVSLVLLALIVTGTFALLPFQVAEHTTDVEGATGRAVAGNATAEFDRPVRVYVEGGGWAAGAVGHFLVGDLRAAGIDATQVATLEDTDGPLLAVRVLSLDAPYRPVSPSTTAEWRFVYVTSGNATMAREQLATEGGPVVLTNEERYVIEGEFTLRDNVRGVISVPQFREGIADRIAATTAERLRAAA